MPYFKTDSGGKGYVNDEGVMAGLEEKGFIRLEGKELFLHIVIMALKDWGIPALMSLGVYHFTGEFAYSLVVFWLAHTLLD